MRFMDKMERKFGKYGIPNLTSYMIACYIAGYLMRILNPRSMAYLGLDVGAIMRGQVWRLVTWLISPPDTSSILLFAISVFLFYYPVGNALERTIGSFRYTVYIFGGILFTIIGAFILHFATGGVYDGLSVYIFTTYYISMSVFLAFATLYPEQQILLWFIIPIKMKWMALVYGGIILYNMFNYIRNGLWMLAVPIVASLLNYVLFFLQTRNLHRFRPKEVQRRREFRRAMEPQSRAKGQGVTKHRCAICGQTEQDDPNLEFRFCSKCNGNYEYCQNHLFTHEHKK